MLDGSERRFSSRLLLEINFEIQLCAHWGERYFSQESLYRNVFLLDVEISSETLERFLSERTASADCSVDTEGILQPAMLKSVRLNLL